MDDTQKQFKRLNRRTRFTLFLVWIALFFTALGIAAGYKNWLRIHEKAKSGLAGVAEIREQLPKFANKEKTENWQASIDKKFVVYKEEFDGSVKQLRHIQDSTQHIADTVYNQVKDLTAKQETSVNAKQIPTVQNWSLSEVHFLLQTAVQIFSLKQDKEGALKAFNLADELLLKKGSTEYLPIRKRIGEDIALVSAYELPDLTLLFNRISKLQKQIEPELDAPVEEGIEKVLKSSDQELEVESLVNRVKKTINDAVVVRKFDKTLRKDMTDLTEQSLYQLLSLRLETLKLMLAQRYDKNYHNQISHILVLLKKYYAKDKYEELKEQLDVLNLVNLKPEQPDVTSSLTLLESLMSEGRLLN